MRNKLSLFLTMKSRRRKCYGRKVWTRIEGRLIRRDFGEDQVPPPSSSFAVNGCTTVTKNTTESAAIKTKRRQRLNDIPSKSLVDDQLVVTARKLSILEMPEECIVLILSFLESHEICRAGTVCKKLYAVSCNPLLWWNADFKFTSLMGNEWHLFPYRGEISDAQRRHLFASFLSQRNAVVTNLTVSFDIDRQSEMFLRFLENCNLEKMNCFDMKWTCTWTCCIPSRRNLKIEAFQSVLRSLGQQCHSIVTLKTQMDVSLTSAVLLSKLKSIQHLELNFQTPLNKSLNESWQLPNKALKQVLSLLNLKVLKLRLRQETADYVLKSDSLEVFEISWTKGFRIIGLDLPKLHTFKAFNVFVSKENESNPCIFNLIDHGCPLIQRINERKFSTPGLCNFHLAEDEMRSMYLCHCDVHAPWRSLV